jgi:hypothetical protein
MLHGDNLSKSFAREISGADGLRIVFNVTAQTLAYINDRYM